MALSEHVERCLANPFSVEARALARSEGAVRELVLSAALERLPSKSRVVDAERLVLARAVVEARAGDRTPLDERTLPARLARSLPRARSAYVRMALAAVRAQRALDALRGSSMAMHEVRRLGWAACFGGTLHVALRFEAVMHDHDVLILGETGTGKELVARALLEGHPGGVDGGPAPYSEMNVAAIPDALVESELFGHVKGAFTGAAATRIGKIRSVKDGALFLDEVGDLPPTVQAKLLRVTEDDVVVPVGSDTGHAADVRYIAATHRDLPGMVARGEFRRDLYERLAGLVIHMPPLRERPEDLVAIGEAFAASMLGEDGAAEHASISRFLRSAEARRHAWPGNVRELQNVLRNLVLGLPHGLGEVTRAPPAGAPKFEQVPLTVRSATATLDDARRWYVAHVLASSNGNIAAAARVLGVDRDTVRRQLATS